MKKLVKRFVGWLFLRPIVLADWIFDLLDESDRRRQELIERKKKDLRS